MPKPKILLVDEDIRYIFLLQAKIGEFYLNEINLEVITEQSYFKEFFLEPRIIDLLIIDEKYYDLSLNKHSIKKILVLTEDEESTGNWSGNVIKIYKYSNMRDIFNIINSRSVGLLSINQARNGTQVVLVTSAAGGVGKTTVALGLCTALEKDYKKVLYIDAESFQTFHHLMNNNTFLDGNDLVELPGTESINHYLKDHIVDYELCYLPAFRVPLLSVGLPPSLFISFIDFVKKSEEYDFIIVDSDSAFNKEKVDLIGGADKVILVTDQSDKGCFATNQIVRYISEIDENKYLFIGNKFNAKNGNRHRREEAETGFTISEYVEAYTDGEISLCNLLELSGLKRISFLLQ